MKSDSVCSLLTGVCLGAAAMYFLDPQTGKRRRALVRDQVTHAKSAAIEMGQAKSKDLAQRATGLWSTITSPLRRHDDSDEAVDARVRSRLGRVVSHPHAIETSVSAGCVQLRGQILTTELDRALEEIRGVPGVREVENHLTAEHEIRTTPPQPERQRSTVGYMGETGT